MFRSGKDRHGRIKGKRIPLAVLLAALMVVALVGVHRLEERDEAQQLERDHIHTGGRLGEDSLKLTRTLIAEGFAEVDAVDVAATLSHVGSDLLEDLITARLLAEFEQAAPPDARPSTDLVMVAEQLEVGGDGLRGFISLVFQKSVDRDVPLHVTAAGLREHGFEYSVGCELVGQVPCSVDMVVELTLDRQHSDYETWGYTNCRLDTNVAHPGCLTFPDCAEAYALVQTAHHDELRAWETARALGHEPGSAGWEKWTAHAGEAAQSSWEAHGTCVAERYGQGEEAYKALVLPE